MHTTITNSNFNVNDSLPRNPFDQYKGEINGKIAIALKKSNEFSVKGTLFIVAAGAALVAAVIFEPLLMVSSAAILLSIGIKYCTDSQFLKSCQKLIADVEVYELNYKKSNQIYEMLKNDNCDLNQFETLLDEICVNLDLTKELNAYPNIKYDKSKYIFAKEIAPRLRNSYYSLADLENLTQEGNPDNTPDNFNALKNELKGSIEKLNNSFLTASKRTNLYLDQSLKISNVNTVHTP